MVSPIEIANEEIKEESEKLDKNFESIYFLSSVLLLLGLLILAIVFAWKIPIFNLESPADSERWGQYGDFFGGIVGTIITFISIVFLYKAYKEQHLANMATTLVNSRIINDSEKTKEVEEQHIYTEIIRQYDDNFKLLMSLYQDSLSSYQSSNTKEGKSSLSVLVSQYIASTVYVSKDVYSKRTRSSSALFEDFITKNSTAVNTHMRLLYQIFTLLSVDYIEEEDKILYAKTLRSQLTDEELILIRYNCMTRSGFNMGKYVFHYNIMKNLPLLNLLEFKQYRKGLSTNQINRLNAELIYYRKEISKLFLKDSSSDKIFHPQNYSKRYDLRIVVNKSNTKYNFTLDKTPPQPGRNYNPLNPIFDKFSVGDLEDLLLSFHYEIFRHSNFKTYNLNAKFQHSNELIGTATRITISIECDNPLIVSYFQVENPNEIQMNT